MSQRRNVAKENFSLRFFFQKFLGLSFQNKLKVLLINLSVPILRFKKRVNRKEREREREIGAERRRKEMKKKRIGRNFFDITSLNRFSEKSLGI